MSAADKLTPVYRKHLAIFEALRRMGIQAEDIFVAYNRGYPATVVRTQGKQFAISTDVIVSTSEDEYIADYQVAAEIWNTTMTADERVALYHQELSSDQFFALVQALRKKGFHLTEVSRALGEN